MRKITICIVIMAFGILAADHAAAWFWEKKEVKPLEVSIEVGNGSKEAVKPPKKKGLWTEILESFREMKEDFKKSSEKGGKDIKEGSKQAGKDLKDAGKKIGQDSKKIPGELKKGGKAIGQGFKQLGKDIKQGTSEVFVGDQKESAK